MIDMLKGWTLALGIIGSTFALIGVFVLVEINVISILKGA
jgi:hypothetical protein